MRRGRRPQEQRRQRRAAGAAARRGRHPELRGERSLRHSRCPRRRQLETSGQNAERQARRLRALPARGRPQASQGHARRARLPRPRHHQSSRPESSEGWKHRSLRPRAQGRHPSRARRRSWRSPTSSLRFSGCLQLLLQQVPREAPPLPLRRHRPRRLKSQRLCQRTKVSERQKSVKVRKNACETGICLVRIVRSQSSLNLKTGENSGAYRSSPALSAPSIVFHLVPASQTQS